MALTVQRLRDQEGNGVAGAKKAEQRIWRAEDGALVADNDPAARFLAYAAGDLVDERDVAAYDRLTGAGTKGAAKPANKATVKPGDK